MMAFVCRYLVVVLSVGALGACSENMTMEPMNPDVMEPDDERPDPVVDPNTLIPPPDEEGCHAIYAQDLLPTFELKIHPEVWQQLEYEWANGEENEDNGIDPKPYHTLTEFKYGDIVIKDAAIRLRGNATYWDWDPDPRDKLQFQIKFDRENPDGHFLGLHRVLFDAATFNRTFLRDRLSLAVMRDAGIPASCANNARLVINGEYYGIFTNLEKIDEIFLDRVFADDPSGDLWKRANWTLKTNLDTPDKTRLELLKDAADPDTGSPEEVAKYLDMEQALRVYAAEAILPDSDGAWAGGLNFYLYDDPVRGKFVLLPWDKDNTLIRFNDNPCNPNHTEIEQPIDPDPMDWKRAGKKFHPPSWFEATVKVDEAWRQRFWEILDEILHDAYAPAKMQQRIADWSAQIKEAVHTDVNKPFDNQTHDRKIEEMKWYVQFRYDALVCRQEGGTMTYCENADGDYEAVCEKAAQ